MSVFRKGHRDAMKRYRLPVEPSWLSIGEVNDAGGCAATKSLMAKPGWPSAIIFNNDAMALGGRRALGELGLAIAPTFR